MAELLLDKDVVYFKDPVGNAARHLHRWWAEAGLIRFEDCVTGHYGTMTVRDALLRLRAVNDMVGASKRNGSYTKYASELQEYQSFVDGMIQLCEKARAQGMPDDEDHMRQMGEEVKARRQSRLLVMPGMNASF